MKKRGLSTTLRTGGILRWSTACILAGGLAGCDRGTRYVATEKDAEMAAIQSGIEKLDSQKSKLLRGEVENNFHIPGVGYYHAEIGTFLEHPHGFVKDGLHFINGEWEYFARESAVVASRPTASALRRVEAVLLEEQKTAENAPQEGGGLGMGNALMMYWLLSANRGTFTPGAGFRQADARARFWQKDVEEERESVARHASSSPGYHHFVNQSRSQGAPVKAGQSVRGGFGSSRSGGGSSFGG
jgi:hypothetical protein